MESKADNQKLSEFLLKEVIGVAKMSYERARKLQQACKLFEENPIGGYPEAVKLVGGDQANALSVFVLRKNWRQGNPGMSEAEIQLNVFDKLSDAGIMS